MLPVCITYTVVKAISALLCRVKSMKIVTQEEPLWGSWPVLRKHSGLACSHHVAGGDKRGTELPFETKYRSLQGGIVVVFHFLIFSPHYSSPVVRVA